MSDVKIDIIPGPPDLALDRAGAGELLIFLHGVGGNRRNWVQQLPHFARHFRALAWDARGYGDSDDYQGPLAFSDYADDLVRVLDHYRVKTAHIVGLSMGGNVAMDFAVRYPDRVRSLVLCDTDRGMMHLPPGEREQFVKLRRDPLLAGVELSDMAPAVVQSLLGPNASGDARQALLDSMLRLHKDSYIKSVEATANFDVVSLIRRISCPVLVVVGEYDSLTPVSEAQAIRDEIAGAEMVVIPDAGHLSNIEQPDIFNREVLDFLSALPG